VPAVTAADIVLTATLVVLVPAYQLWRSLTRDRRPSGSRVGRYRHSLAMIGTLTAALAAIWWQAGRPLAALGFGWPLSLAGGVGLGVALALIVAIGIAARRAKPSADGAANEAARAMLPQSTIERRWYLLFALGAGAGWEILYRGYLWWALAPVLGSIGAVAVMAISYGVAHGYNGIRPLLGALLSALLFSVGYAVTLSLWWLIAIHIAFPLFGLLVRPPGDALEK
jgi:membrane protease YdiL (CAAX protease family)